MVHTTLVAAVSADGKIADKDGKQEMLTCNADRAHLKAHIRASDLLLFGRRTYEEHKSKLAAYNCVILTREVDEPKEIASHHLLWNPAHTSFESICARFKAKSVCILGGSEIYTFAKQQGWIDEFVLTYVPGVRLKEGIPLFQDIPDERVWQALESGTLGFKERTQDTPGSSELIVKRLEKQ